MDSYPHKLINNVLVLYLRMMLVTAISLLISRLLLLALGINDYGLFNLIAGFVSLFGVIKCGMMSSVQRFMSYYIGKNSKIEINATFSTFICIYIAISLAIIVIAEPIGIFAIENLLNIPSARLSSAVYVFHFSLISFIINVLTTPFSSTIISYERMDIYSYITITEVIGKLLIAFFLRYGSENLIELYSFMLSINSIIILIILYLYCKLVLKLSCNICTSINKCKEILGFSSWTMIGGIANICTTQGINVIIGIYFTPALCAARAIGTQVQSLILALANNVQLAIDPKIIKTYSENEIIECEELISASSRFIMILMYMVALPIALNIETILKIWLNNVPDYSGSISIYLLVAAIVDMIANAPTKGVMATGNVKGMFLYGNGILICSIPAHIFICELDFSINAIFELNLAFYIISMTIKIWIYCDLFDIPKYAYFKTNVIKPLIICAVVLIPVYFCKLIIENPIVAIVSSTAVAMILISAISYKCIMNAKEKVLFKDIVNNYAHRILFK